MGYALIRGKVFIGDRDLATGAIKNLTEFHAAMCEIEVKEERATHYNSSDAVKAKDLSIVAQMDGTVTVDIDTHSPDVLAMALGGEVTVQTSGPTFAAMAFSSGITVGQTYAIPGGHVNLSTLTVTDSAGTPATLAAGTNYTIDLVSGLITFTNLGSFTQPFKAAGQVANGANIVSIMTKRGTEKFIRVDGINIADGDKRMVVDIYRAAVGTSKVTAKTEGNDVNKYSFSADLLRDPNALNNSVFGKYGRIVNL